MSLDVIANKLVNVFGGKETEQNWEKIDTLLKEFSNDLAKTSNDEIIAAAKKCREIIQNSVNQLY